MWINGIPGSGKSILCSKLVDQLSEKQKGPFAFFFFSHSAVTRDLCTEMLRTFIAQLVRADSTLVGFTRRSLVDNGFHPSSRHVKTLFSQVLSSLPYCRILVDGIDECDEGQQKEILSILMAQSNNESSKCRLLVSSREEGLISRALKHKVVIPLRENTDTAIDIFIDSSMEDLKAMFNHLDEELLRRMRSLLRSKADGRV